MAWFCAAGHRTGFNSLLTIRTKSAVWVSVVVLRAGAMSAGVIWLLDARLKAKTIAVAISVGAQSFGFTENNLHRASQVLAGAA